jgi:hypothetical protein
MKELCDGFKNMNFRREFFLLFLIYKGCYFNSFFIRQGFMLNY